jgi:sulfur relay (sulfurtransferase) complex TusBCD TusD component (DsrE family)
LNVSLRGKKLGVLISARPGQSNFSHGVRLVEAALAEGVEVYVYCVDDAVEGVGDARLQKLRTQGAKLFACAYAARRRHLPITEQAVFSGLTILSDLIAGTDRFVSFN